MIVTKKCFTVIIILLFIRRQIERNKLAREKQLREIAEKEKSIMEQRLMQYQEEIRLANEALVSILRFFLKTVVKNTNVNNTFFREDLKKLLIFWLKSPE